MKEISTVEFRAFLEFAPLYFEYLDAALFNSTPTILGKIFGVFQVEVNINGKDSSHFVVVMENVFYKKKLSKTYDLKGSTRNRKADGNSVLWDQNLIEVLYSSPLWVDEHSKTNLKAAIWNDTLFLSSLQVMDYSLIVGIDATTNQLYVGIVDYLRTYTWDKKLESWIKRGGKALPTVISPKEYKKRFRQSMDEFFVVVPNKSTPYRTFCQRPQCIQKHLHRIAPGHF
jgi:1-phosphatidylinositol-3-phosphate 5-kinase